MFETLTEWTEHDERDGTRREDLSRHYEHKLKKFFFNWIYGRINIQNIGVQSISNERLTNKFSKLVCINLGWNWLVMFPNISKIDASFLLGKRESGWWRKKKHPTHNKTKQK